MNKKLEYCKHDMAIGIEECAWCENESLHSRLKASENQKEIYRQETHRWKAAERKTDEGREEAERMLKLAECVIRQAANWQTPGKGFARTISAEAKRYMEIKVSAQSRQGEEK